MKENQQSAAQLREVITKFIRVDKLHRAACDAAVGSLGIQRNQHMILMYLARHEAAPPSQIALAKEFGITSAAVSGTLQCLERNGWILRTASKTDNRRNTIALTEKSRELITKTRSLFESVDRQMTAGLTQEELSVFCSCLERMTENLQEQTGE